MRCYVANSLYSHQYSTSNHYTEPDEPDHILRVYSDQPLLPDWAGVDTPTNVVSRANAAEADASTVDAER